MKLSKALQLEALLGTIGSSCIVHAESQSTTVKGGSTQTVEFKNILEAGGYSISVMSASKWEFKDGFDIYGSDGWRKYADGKNIKSATNNAFFAAVAFPVTLSGTIVPLGSGKGTPPPTDWTVRGTYQIGTPSITPTIARIPMGQSQDFTYYLDDKASPAFWGIDNSLWTTSFSSTFTFPNSSVLNLEPEYYAIQARLDDSGIGQVTAGLYYIGVKDVYADDLTSTTDVPGDAETKVILKDSPSFTLKSTPEPFTEWPEDYPQWKGGSIGAVVQGDESYLINTDKTGEYIVSANCGNSRAMKIAVMTIAFNFKDKQPICATPDITQIPSDCGLNDIENINDWLIFLEYISNNT